MPKSCQIGSVKKNVVLMFFTKTVLAINILFLKKKITMELCLSHNLNFLVPLSLQPAGVNFLHLKLRIIDLTEFLE